MRVGVLRETKAGENRVALLPSGARALAERDHEIFFETQAGLGSGFPDNAYEEVGAKIVATPEEVIGAAELVTKVKEPSLREISLMRPGQTLFDFLHLAPEAELTHKILDAGIIAIGFETVQLDDGSLPLLVPMSEVAGRLSIQIGAHYLQADQGGRGILLGGVPGVPRGRVTVIGAGVVGTAAVRVAVGLGAEVSVLDIDQRRLSHLYDVYHGGINTLYSNAVHLEKTVPEADIVIGAVPAARCARPGSRYSQDGGSDGRGIGRDRRRRRPGRLRRDHAPDLARRSDVQSRRGRTLWCDEHARGRAPHVDRCPGSAILPYLLDLCDRGVDEALRSQSPLARGVNCYRGEVTIAGVADAIGLPVAPSPWA